MGFFFFQSWLKVLCGCTEVKNQKEPVGRDCYFFCTWQEDDQGQDTCRLFSGKDKECSRRKTIFHTSGWVLCEVRMSFCCACKNVSALMSMCHLRGKSYKWVYRLPHHLVTAKAGLGVERELPLRQIGQRKKVQLSKLRHESGGPGSGWQIEGAVKQGCPPAGCPPAGVSPDREVRGTHLPKKNSWYITSVRIESRGRGPPSRQINLSRVKKQHWRSGQRQTSNTSYELRGVLRI